MKLAIPKFQYDLVLIGVTLLLMFYGTVMIYSTSAVYAELRYNNSYHFLQRHLAHVIVGIIVLCAGLYVDYRKWQEYAPWMMLGMLLLLTMVLIPGVGHEVKGGRRWIRVMGFGLQPAELLKFVLIVYVASYLERKQQVIATFLRGMSPSYIVTGVYLLLVLLQPDFGTVVLMSLTILLMLFSGGGRLTHIFGSVLGVAVLGGALVATQAYRMRRILSFLDPWQDPLGAGFQIIQSFIAIGTGGWTGRGLGESRQKLFFLPDAHTDFIFAILSEELGFLWVCVLVILFGILIWRGFWIAWNMEEMFGRYLAFGCITLMSFQIIFNLYVVTGMLPTKGLPLPFISFGGTSLVINMFIVGVLLNISSHLHGSVNRGRSPAGSV